MLYGKNEYLMLTKDGVNFNSLIKEAKKIKNNSVDFIIPNSELKNMEFTKNGTLVFNTEDNTLKEVNIGRTAFTQLCNKIKVPVRYIDNCISVKATDLARDNINTWIKLINSNSNYLARIYNDNNLRGLLTSSYSIFDSNEILEIVADEIDLNEYEIKGHLLNEERLHLRIVKKEPIGVERDKDLFSGFTIDSSDVGRNTLTVRFFIFKQICTNGLIMKRFNDNLLSQIHRGIDKDKFRESFKNSLKLIDELTDEAIDIINKAGENKIPQFDSMKDYNKFILKIHDKTELPKELIDKAIEIMDEKYDQTAWGLVNGLTELAQGKNFENRLNIETLASNILTMKI